MSKKFTDGDRGRDIDKALAEINVQVGSAGDSMTVEQVVMVVAARKALTDARTRSWEHKEYSSTIKTIASGMPTLFRSPCPRAFLQSIAEAIGE